MPRPASRCTRALLKHVVLLLRYGSDLQWFRGEQLSRARKGAPERSAASGECQARYSISSCVPSAKHRPTLPPRCGAREHYGAGTEAKHTVPS